MLKEILESFVDNPFTVAFFLLIMLIFFIIKKGTEGAIKNDTTFIEFYLNGHTPRSWRKNKNRKRRVEDKEENTYED